MKALTVPPLGARDVHVWICRLAPEVSMLAPLLSDDERARAQRYRFDVHRRRFIAARATARLLLGAYAGRDAASLRFEYEPLGRPRLAGGAVSFNLSHCDDHMLLAVRRDGDVGADIECLRAVAEAEDIAGKYFDREVAEEIRRAPEPERSHLFLRHWTRHEACGKLFGKGVVESAELHKDVITVDFASPDGHAAAVVVESGSGDLTCHDFHL